MKILFVCAMNKMRSPTAEKIYQNDNRVEVRSAGLSQSSPRKLVLADLEWADLILVMENEHKRRIVDNFRGLADLPRIESLEISADLNYMSPELIEQIRAAVEPYLKEAGI